MRLIKKNNKLFIESPELPIQNGTEINKGDEFMVTYIDYKNDSYVYENYIFNGFIEGNDTEISITSVPQNDKKGKTTTDSMSEFDTAFMITKMSTLPSNMSRLPSNMSTIPPQNMSTLPPQNMSTLPPNHMNESAQFVPPTAIELPQQLKTKL